MLPAKAPAFDSVASQPRPKYHLRVRHSSAERLRNQARTGFSPSHGGNVCEILYKCLTDRSRIVAHPPPPLRGTSPAHGGGKRLGEERRAPF
jgi:hypothetical protein